MNANHYLGYPAGARLLIINADDFGMCHAHNEAILHALKTGVVTSTSLMAPCPWAPHAMRLLNENREIPFGVHLTLICDDLDYRWGPLSSKSAVPSLLNERGLFYPNNRRDEMLARAEIREVEIEFREQIERVLAEGLRPTHLDWHCLADGGREDIFKLTFRLAREYGVALRTHYRHHAKMCHQLGLPANDHDVLDSYSMDPTTKAQQYARMLRDLPAGLSEWAVHPSLGNDESRALEPGTWQIRKADFDFVMSPEARDVVEQEGIVLIDYRALQTVWKASETEA